MIRTIGTTGISELISCNPSIEEVTVIAGVMTPSARRADPPIMVRIATHGDFSLISAARAKIPPSPLLSALKAIKTYFIVVERVSVQKIQDKPP